jgi:hypothetical protein
MLLLRFPSVFSVKAKASQHSFSRCAGFEPSSRQSPASPSHAASAQDIFRQNATRHTGHPPMNVFGLHNRIVSDYSSYIKSFINIADPAISMKVQAALSEGTLWPDPLLQFNPAYEQAGTVKEDASTRPTSPRNARYLQGLFSVPPSSRSHPSRHLRKGLYRNLRRRLRQVPHLYRLYFSPPPRRINQTRRISGHRLSDERSHQLDKPTNSTSTKQITRMPQAASSPSK